MASIYHATYHLHSHKRDNLIEFIKSMLLTPFVLHTTPAPITDVDREQAQIIDSVLPKENHDQQPLHPALSPIPTDRDLTPEEQLNRVEKSRNYEARDENTQRMAEILGNIEKLINEHVEMQKKGLKHYSRLYRLVPTIGNFYTPLPLREAFLNSKVRYGISGRRYVPPSFNDIRRIMNSAQVMAGAENLKLITFDGDMTLYDDGKDFTEDNSLTTLLVRLLQKDINVAIVTAAGYGDNPAKYEKKTVWPP